MDTTITALPTANSIDATQDWLAIDTTSLATTQKINRNTLLGITGSPVGTTDTQSITNKTIGNTNTLTVKDTLFTLQDDGDTTKQAKFQLSGITTATTRTYTLPNASSTLADISTAQTFTNKTLTSPAITGGTIDNSTVTVDSIAGHTATTTGTVYGVAITAGVIGSSALLNSVNTAAIQDGSVTNVKLSTTAGQIGGAFTSWTPTFVNLSGGTLNYAVYIQVGKLVHFKWKYTLGGAGMGTLPTFTVPVTMSSRTASTTDTYQVHVNMNDASGNVYPGGAAWADSNTFTMYALNAASTWLTYGSITATVPFTWTSTDYIMAQGWYEAA